MVVSESAAYIKAGGLGDVIHSLAKALIKLGHSLYVIMPKYSKIKAYSPYGLVKLFIQEGLLPERGLLGYMEPLTFCMLDTPTILKRQRNWGIFLL